MTSTNEGDANATALSVLIGINPTRGSFTANITQVATGWVADYQGYNTANQSFEWIFTRAAGLAVGEANASTLTFRFPAGMTGTSTGTIVVSAPVTTPPGDNQGSVGQYL